MNMEAENEKGKRISMEQRERMLEFMVKHPSLATNKFTAPDGAKHKHRLLTELTANLNSVANGVDKSADKWLKSWQDWRSDTKSKAALLKREINQTGGGRVSTKAKPLTPLEERLLSFLGPTIVSGHEDVMDPMVAVCGSSSAEQQIPVLDETSNFMLPLNGPAVASPMTVNELSLEPSESPQLFMMEESSQSRSSVPSPSESTTVMSSEGTKKSNKLKRKECKTLAEDEHDAKLLKISERQVEIATKSIELQQQKLDLLARQTTAMESASSAFISAMQAMDMYYKRKMGLGEFSP